jgi:hypothetical protein
MLITEIFHAAGLRPPPVSIVTLSAQPMTTLIATGRFVGMSNSVAQLSATRGIEDIAGNAGFGGHYNRQEPYPRSTGKAVYRSARAVAKSISAPTTNRR